jgi:hypothetical protein
MDKIESLYLTDSYFSKHSSDVWISIFLIIITIVLICYNAYKSVIYQVKLNWNLHRCNPIYLPFAGLIMPELGKSFTDKTVENLEYCIQTDISSIFSIIMMPIEFAIYVTVDCIDGIMMTFVAIVSFSEWLQNILGEIYEELYQKILNFIIPIIEIILHYRDITSKTNGVLISAIFSILNIYNTTVSGASFIMSIVINVLGLLIGVFYVIIAIAIILCLSFFGIASGLALYASAAAIATGVIAPVIVAYAQIASTFEQTFNIPHPSAPSMPKIPRIRIKMPRFRI